MRKEEGKIDIIKTFNLICQKYTTNTSEDNLNSLLDLFQIMKPNWVRDFNNLDNRLTKNKSSDFLSEQLPPEYTVDNLKANKNEDKDQYTDIMQRGRIIHLSNKIAHQFDYIFQSKIKEYMRRRKIETNTPEEFYEIKRLIKQRYNQRTKPKIKEIAETKLIKQYGFKKDDFSTRKSLNMLGLPSLIKAYSDAMYIKDTEIESVNNLVQRYSREDVSYGIKEDDEYNTLFIMDIPKFGQFAVHVKDPSLIAQIKTKYKMPLYKRESLMLVDHLSEEAKEFIEQVPKDASMDKELKISEFMKEPKKQRARLRERIKQLDLTSAGRHEMAVKSGLKRKELQEIDSAEEER